jgi:deoxyribodipyrimidine photo-lyase
MARVGIMWFSRDLRIDDNPAWSAATSACDVVVPLYVHEPSLLALAPVRTAYLAACLTALDSELRGLGSRLHGAARARALAAYREATEAV